MVAVLDPVALAVVTDERGADLIAVAERADGVLVALATGLPVDLVTLVAVVGLPERAA